MKWTIADFPVNPDNSLNPKVRNKAVEIANQLSASGQYTEEEVIRKAIQLAEEWFYESEG